MTVVVTTTQSGPYAAASQTTFAVTFQSAGDDEIEVTLEGIVVNPALYTFNRDDDGTGEVIMASPVTGEVIIYSVPSFQQHTEFEQFGSFNPSQLNPPLDAAAVRDLYLLDELSRTPRLPRGSDPIDYLGDPAARAGRAFGFDEDGNFILMDREDMPQGLPGDIGDLKVKTPIMFGARPASEVPNTEAGWTANSIAVQACLDFLFDADNAKEYWVDLRGEWKVNRQIFAAYPVNDEITRRVAAGTLRFPAKASMPGGVRAPYGLTIAGINTEILGKFAIIHDGGISWANKPIRKGIQVFNCNNATFGGFDVFGSSHDPLYLDPAGGSTTFRAGTPYEVTYGYSNNIGIDLGVVRGWYCGTPPNQVAMNKTYTLTGHTQFVGAPQRSLLTFNENHDFDTSYDVVWSRYEKAAAGNHSTLAFNSAGTITMGASDWVTQGWQVGEEIIPQSGNNAGTLFELISFDTGNTVAHVWPRPVTEAAAAIDIWSKLQPHNVRSSPAANQVEIWPLLPARMVAGMKVYAGWGWALNDEGGNTANVTATRIVGTVCGGGLYSHSLYGPKVGTVETEFAPCAIMYGHDPAQACLGLQVEQIHSEGTTYDLIKSPQGFSHARIGGGSSLSLSRAMVMTNRVNGTVANMPKRALYYTTFDPGGEPLFSYDNSTGIGSNSFLDGEFTNRPPKHIRQFYGNGGTIVLGADFPVLDLIGEQNWGKLYWAAAVLGGGAPGGTLTFSLNQELTDKGWTLAGDTSLTAPSGPVEFDLHWMTENKQILIRKSIFRIAGAAIPDVTGGATVDAEARAAINAILARMRAHKDILT
jgi:hypothetical protein